MISSSLIVLVVLLFVIWFWQNALRAKEAALRECKTLCKEHQMQLLDETVSLKKLRLRRNEDGRVNFYRIYTFEYNLDGNTRHVGEIILLGVSLIEHRFFSHDKPTAMNESIHEASPAPTSARILDFKKYQAENDAIRKN